MPRTTRSFIPPTLAIVWLAYFLILLPKPAHAAMYSWIDADGVKHFTNRPPPENVKSVRQIEEIPYAEAADRERQVRDARYFDQQAMESTLRRLRQTERALSESLERARAAERRIEEQAQAYDYDDDDYGYDDGYYWGSSYGGDGYADDDRRDRKNRDRRQGRHRERSEDRHGYRSKDGRHDDWRATKSSRARRHERVSQRRRSKRERGVVSGLTRVVRAIPSPYYMGYRPVYPPRDRYYSSDRGGHGRRGAHRRGGGGSRRSGGHARASF